MTTDTHGGGPSGHSDLDKKIRMFGVCAPMPPLKPGAIDPKTGERAAIDQSKLWQSGQTIGVHFLNGDPAYHDVVREYAKLWTGAANLKLDFDSPGRGKDVTINFEPLEPGGFGLYNSNIGTDSRVQSQTEPSMNLIFPPGQPDSYYRRYVLHEFGHALGLIHEHMSPGITFQWNKPNLYAFYARTYNWGQDMVDSQVLAKYEGDVTNTVFDEKSVMLYPIAEGLTDPPIVTDWNDQLSASDRFLIGLYYPFQETELTVGVPANDSIAAPGGFVNFKFTTPDDGRYTVETTGDLPIQMYLLGPNSRGKFIAEDHGSGAGRNARIERDLAFAEYHVQVRTQTGTDTGPFGVSVKAV